MKPSVTIAIPTRNRIDFLQKALQNVLDQDYENLDILISDNGSTDGTDSYLRSMARTNSRLRLRRNEKSVPIITHFNQCLQNVNGEFFILFCDDDQINRSFVSSLAEGLIKNPKAAVAIPTNAIIDNAGNLIRTLPLPRENSCSGIEFIDRWLWKSEQLSVANLLTLMGRTETMKKFGYQPFERGLNSDNLLFLQLALTGEIIFCKNAVFYWRDHEKQTGSSTPPRQMSKSGREFLNFVKSEKNLPALESQPPSVRRKIREGIRRMNAEALLHGIGFFENPFRLKTIGNLLSTPLNFDAWRLALRLYYRQLREPSAEEKKSPAS